MESDSVHVGRLDCKQTRGAWWFKRYQIVRDGIIMIDPLSMGQEWDTPLYHPASFDGFKMVSGVAVCPNAASFRARHHSQQLVL